MEGSPTKRKRLMETQQFAADRGITVIYVCNMPGIIGVAPPTPEVLDTEDLYTEEDDLDVCRIFHHFEAEGKFVEGSDTNINS